MACDLYYNSVVSLLHFDGSDGSTTFTDATGKTWTGFGNAQIDTAQSKFGGASLLLDGTGDYLSTPDSADWHFGSGNFTVELWVRPAAIGSVMQVFGQWESSAGYAFSLFVNTDGTLSFNANGSALVTSGAYALSVNTWYHVAISKAGGNTKLFIDGVEKGTASDALTYNNSTDVLVIGRNNDAGGVWYFNGHVEEFRITKGVGRYTTGFTPETAAFPESLCVALEGGVESVASLSGSMASGLAGGVEASAEADGAITVNKLLAGGINAAANLGNTGYITDAEDSLARASGQIQIVVRAQGTPDAEIEIEVGTASSTVSAPIEFAVRGNGTASAQISFAVVSDLTVQDWTLTASIGGSNVTSSLTGQVRVAMEEGGSRTAEFSLVVASTPVNPLSYVGQSVSINLVRDIGGTTVTSPLFRGVVEYPTYQPVGALMRLDCSQDLQHIIAALDRTDIDDITGGGYHRSVHGDVDDNWDYAQACMETQAASLDCGVMGNPRTTAWDGLTVWRTFTAADIDDPDIEVIFPRRSDLVNQVDCSFEYRYYRLRERHEWLGWSSTAFDAYKHGSQYPTVQDIEAAVEGTGWQIVSGVYFGHPSRIPYADGYVEIPASAVSRAQVHVAQRHAQTVTETSTMTVQAPESITNSGTIAQTLRGALASEWSPSAWESDITASLDADDDDETPHSGGFRDGYGGGGTTTANSLGSYSEMPATYAGGNLELDWAPDALRADAEAGIDALLNTARVKILRSHRLARASATVDILPELDVNRAAGINITEAQVEGKVAAVEHILDIESGMAITRFSLAVSGIGAAGVVSETPIAPPVVDTEALLEDAVGADSYTLVSLGNYRAGLNAYTDNIMGWLVNPPPTIEVVDVPAEGGETITKTITNPFYTADEYPVTGFRVRMPGVADALRNPADTAVAETYLVQIPEDTFSL